MVKVAAFNCRKDELEFFHKYSEELGIELLIIDESPSLKNLDLVRGCQAVSVITTPISGELIEGWKELGILAISTRTVGYEHVDCTRAAELGIPVSNVGYSPDTVAEYAVMSILMALRRMKTILLRAEAQDYSLTDVRGKELCRLTVGVIGTGRIGETVIRDLSGFGCRILAYDLHEKESVKAMAEYASLERIWAECDVITLHAPSTAETHHLINKESIGRMKDGVVIVNTARGTLIDTPALIEALESGKIGAAALDVVEHETGIYYKDFKYQPVAHHEMAILKAMPNVLMTPHTAFFTDEAVGNMVEYSLKSCVLAANGERDPWQVN